MTDQESNKDTEHTAEQSEENLQQPNSQPSEPDNEQPAADNAGGTSEQNAEQPEQQIPDQQSGQPENADSELPAEQPEQAENPDSGLPIDPNAELNIDQMDGQTDEEPDPEEILKAKKKKQLNLLIGAVAVLLVVMLVVLISGAVGAVQNTSESSSAVQTFGKKIISSGSDDTDSFNFAVSGTGETAEAESAVIAGASSGADSQSSEQSSTESSANDGFSGAKISKDEFNSLQDGMTYGQAASVIGGNGKLTISTGNMQVYEWPGYGSADGAFARLTFKSGKLAKKYQYGL